MQDFYNIIPFPHFVFSEDKKVDLSPRLSLVETPHVIHEKKHDFPSFWSNAIEITLNRNKPQNISESRWRAITKRLDVLIHEEKRHLLKMIEYDWSLEEVFGCHKFAPDVRIDGMGLLMLLKDSSTIAEITPDLAILRHKDGAHTSYRLGSYKNVSEFGTLPDIP
jgi:hypothetical protein